MLFEVLLQLLKDSCLSAPFLHQNLEDLVVPLEAYTLPLLQVDIRPQSHLSSALDTEPVLMNSAMTRTCRYKEPIIGAACTKYTPIMHYRYRQIILLVFMVNGIGERFHDR
jgi:hypothetical protein